MQTIGFTTTFFTLWEVSTPIMFEGRLIQNINFVQNLSHTLEGAKAKLQGNFEVDLELRGSHSWVRILKDREEFMPSNQFTFGKLFGQNINFCLDVWQLKRARESEKSAERKLCAENRLVELGELVRVGSEVLTKWEHEKRIAEAQKNALQGGLQFEHGQKVVVEVRIIERFHFEGTFGTTFVQVFETKCGKLIKLVGANPIPPHEGWAMIKGTIKHTDFRGEAETRILRVKVVAVSQK